MLTIETKLERFPPCVCRMLAREGKNNRHTRLLEDEEIAERSGLHLSKVRSLSWLVSWDSVTVEEMLRFSKACGINFSDRESLAKHYKYTQLKNPFLYLRKHKDWGKVWSKMFQMYSEELMRKYE